MAHHFPWDLAGAVFTQDGSVAHYGSLTREQKSLREGALVYLGSSNVLQFTGSDALPWLDSLTSQQLAFLGEGDSAETLILSPQGRVEHQLKIIRGYTASGTSCLWAIVEKSDADACVQWLRSMVFMKDVVIQDVSEEFFVCGGFSAVVPEAISCWVDPWRHVQAGGYQYGADREEYGQWNYCEYIIPWKKSATMNNAWAGFDAREALRVMAGRPRFACETDELSLPHEVNWLRSAVHLDKGCYRGQETVAKVHHVGHPPRRLVLLHIDGSEHTLVEHGQEVMYDGKKVGFVTTGAFHDEAGPLALAIVKRTVPADAVLNISGVAASQEILVAVDAGATAHIDRGGFLSSGARKPLM